MKPWVKAAVSVALLALLFVVLPWSDVRTAIARLPGRVWFLVLAGFVAGHVVSAFKWRLLVNTGHGELRPSDAIRCHGAGLFANMCLPSFVGGDVLRALLAGRATGHPEAAVLAGVADRTLDMSTMLILIVLGALASHQALPGWSRTVVGVALALGVVAAFVALPLLLRRPLKRWPRKLRRPLARGMVSLRRMARRPRVAVMAFALSVTIQSAFVMLNVWIGRSVGIDVATSIWFMAWPLAKIAGLLPVSLGGIAVRDATFGALLVPFGVPMATGVVAHLVWQTVMIAGGLIAGLTWWLLSRRTTAGAHDVGAELHAAAESPRG